MTFREWLLGWISANQRFFVQPSSDSAEWEIVDSLTGAKAQGSSKFAMESTARFEASHMNNAESGRASQIADAFAQTYSRLSVRNLDSVETSASGHSSDV